MPTSGSPHHSSHRAAWQYRLASMMQIVDARDRAAGREPGARDLLTLFAADGLSGQTLGEIAVQMLRPMEASVLQRGPAGLDQPLVHAILRRSYVCRLEWERAIVAARRDLAVQLIDRGALTPPASRVMVSLAFQAANNEYLVPPSAEDEQRLDVLAHGARRSMDSATVRAYLVASAAFEPPHKRRLWDVWRRLVPELDTDSAALAARLETDLPRGPHDGQADSLDGVEAVRRQYERRPYPRWFDLTVPLRTAVADGPDRVLSALARNIPERPLRVLVAGCGTGQHPLTLALQYSDVEVWAIDISEASLDCAVRHTRRYGATVHYQRADLLDATELGGPFHIIEAIGVLHHLPNPDEGLAALRRVLAPGGLIKIGLYSKRARTPLADSQAMVRAFLAAGRGDLSRARQALLEARPAGIETAVSFRDFFCLSGFADLLHHPVEHSYTPREMSVWLRDHGLSCRGITNLPPPVAERYRDTFPEDPWLRDLTLIDQFESEAELVPSILIFWAQAH